MWLGAGAATASGEVREEGERGVEVDAKITL